MAEFHEALFRNADNLDSIAKEADNQNIKIPLEKLEMAANEVGKSWSGSWLGYHSRVYYQNLQAPPPGAHFSTEWGLMDLSFISGSTGDWEEYAAEQIRKAIFSMADNPDLKLSEETAKKAQTIFENERADIVSTLSAAIEIKKDPFIIGLKDEAEKLKLFTISHFIQSLCPSGRIMTRDTTASGQGFQTPPHISVLAELMAMRQPIESCGALGKIARRAASHLIKTLGAHEKKREMGTNIFIGHGSSKLWRELKDFIQDRLQLPWDEFNRVPIAGTTNTERLSKMLNDAAIAFLIMTAEDEYADGKMHARMNVIHEAGLFQGRLGFTKAIILLEESCEEFSNINGLGQIRFPKGNIKAAFEDIRRVLEREGLLESSL